ncbi:MAG: DUF3299 domain-containing protein [Halofilum sp. (in: g-proteobacteria)]
MSATLAWTLVISAAVHARETRDLEWLELLPDEDREAMERLPETMAELNRDMLESGTDELNEEVEMPDVLSSTRVREALDGEYVRIPGFLVPLAMNERGEPNRFFLVPYFGACIHSPPPPPNQMLHVTFSGGVPDHGNAIPYSVTGELQVERTENDLGIATYAIDADDISEF